MGEITHRTWLKITLLLCCGPAALFALARWAPQLPVIIWVAAWVITLLLTGLYVGVFGSFFLGMASSRFGCLFGVIALIGLLTSLIGLICLLGHYVALPHLWIAPGIAAVLASVGAWMWTPSAAPLETGLHRRDEADKQQTRAAAYA
ncbi:MAG: hypothetical protein LBF16_07725, partial [Pseudomonadales bacterium]|nr:hypothetical protein [Pseudomonadales bacterium]